MILTAVLAPVIAPFEYDAQDFSSIRLLPSADHLFGADKYGRDVFSRVVYGSRIALLVASLVVVVELALGVTLGMMAGYFGGKVDHYRDKKMLASEIPSPKNPPSGCRFHTRCPLVMEQCKSIKPQMKSVESGHRVACHLYE